MGKSQRQKANKAKPGSAAARYNPYARSTTRITDLCDMLSSATSGTIKAGTEMDDEDHAGPAERGSDDEGGGAGVEDTEGKILQRHKREWKGLRSQLGDKKAHKKAMGAATLAKKSAKKELGKEIKALGDNLLARHQREIAEFRAKQGAAAEAKAGAMESEAVAETTEGVAETPESDAKAGVMEN
mmetsp:Transcript_48444/g.115184  ORF Transcript_48444/g.115184 Transcript_48444/m.115184 type:complete len:185 (+) Transcript_48444:169-723(+)